MITTDSLIELDSDTAVRKPLFARWSRTRTGRPAQARGTDVCLRLWGALFVAAGFQIAVAVGA